MIRSLLILGSAIALAGCASLPASRPDRKLADVPAGCIRKVDSLIPAKSPCMTPGNAYSGRQLRQTGHTNLARALQSLDPAVTATPP